MDYGGIVAVPAFQQDIQSFTLEADTLQTLSLTNLNMDQSQVSYSVSFDNAPA